MIAVGRLVGGGAAFDAIEEPQGLAALTQMMEVERPTIQDVGVVGEVGVMMASQAA